jgi:hypothetical protein
MLATLAYSTLAFICFFLLNIDRISKAVGWRIVTLASVPLDVSMMGIFIAKDAIFGVHSFECAAARGVVMTIEQNYYLQNISSLELQRRYHAQARRGSIYIDGARDVCLIPPSVYLVCVMAA